MKTKWISLKRLKEHELFSTMRVLSGREVNFVDMYLVLLELERKASSAFLKTVGTFVLGFFLISALKDGSDLRLVIGGFSLSVPVAYSSAFMGLAFWVGCMQMIQWMAILSTRSRVGVRFRVAGFSAPMFALTRGFDDMALAIPILANGFLKSKLPIQTLGNVMLLVTIVGPSIALLAIAGFFVTEQFSLIVDGDTNLVEKFAAGFGAASIIGACVYTVAFFVPLPAKKNTFSIRWGFLYPIASSRAAIDRWISEENG